MISTFQTQFDSVPGTLTNQSVATMRTFETHFLF